VPRVARLMALAIRFDQFVREAWWRTMRELARLRHVTRARMTQIMNAEPRTGHSGAVAVLAGGYFVE
jgi:hypothetical protein